MIAQTTMTYPMLDSRFHSSFCLWIRPCRCLALLMLCHHARRTWIGRLSKEIRQGLSLALSGAHSVSVPSTYSRMMQRLRAAEYRASRFFPKRCLTSFRCSHCRLPRRTRCGRMVLVHLRTERLEPHAVNAWR